ncbi:MAG: hypothetical protein MSB11_03010 [Prevotella sp.]|nr:hypothetical protein [Prevotella sp.]
MNNYEEDGVLISQDAIENSLHKKAKRKQTLAQLPVYVRGHYESIRIRPKYVIN